MIAANKPQPIIVIKKKGGHGGHHGGAWKVAYADFVTAMMSLFIVLWLMNSSDKIKKAVAGYFNDPKGTASLLGTTMNGTPTPAELADPSMKELKEKLEKQIQQKVELQKLSKQIEITITAEGLRIELLEGKDGTFYQSGSAQLSAQGQALLALLAGELKTIRNPLLIEGHTDAAPFSNETGYSNWELSADRANAARRLMQQVGVRADQVTQVRGYANQMLRVKSNPYDPTNRRISILVKNDGDKAPVIGPLKAGDAQIAVGSGEKPAGTASSGNGAPQVGTKPGAAPPKTSAATPVQPNAAAAAKPSAAAAGKASAAPAKAAGESGWEARLKGMLPGKKM